MKTILFNGPSLIPPHQAPGRKPSARMQAEWNARKAVVKNAASGNEYWIDDTVGVDMWTGGGITGADVRAWLGKVSANEIIVNINSPGGDVFEGVDIYNALLEWQAKKDGRTVRVNITSLAASIASVIAMAGDEIVMAGNAMMMIHKAWTFTAGNDTELANIAATLTSIDSVIADTFKARTKGQKNEILKWMKAETWMTAAEAMERGFATAVKELKGAAPPDDSDEPPDVKPEDRLRAAMARHQNLSRWLKQA